MRFFVQKIQNNQAILNKNNKDEDSDPYFKSFSIKAKEEVKNTLSRLLFRKKYSLPPNDPRFLSLTDEEIYYELVLQAELEKFLKDYNNNQEIDNESKTEIFESDSNEFEDITRRLESGENIDLFSILPNNSWEKI